MTVFPVWLDAWAAALGRACWQGGVLVLFAWILCRFVRSIPARFQCWFWRLALLKFLLVLICPMPLRLPWLPALSPVASDREITVMPVPALATSPAKQMSPGKNSEQGVFDVKETLFLAWIVGIGWCSVRLLAVWQTAKRLRKQGKVIGAPTIVQQLAMQREAFALRFSPQLLEIPGSGSPMTIGVFRPVVSGRAAA